MSSPARARRSSAWARRWPKPTRPRADTFAEADEILGFALSELCFAGPSDVLTDTRNAQPAILTTSIAAWRALGAAHPELPGPLCVAGHSLGEYSALVAAGALAFADAVRLTRRAAT